MRPAMKFSVMDRASRGGGELWAATTSVDIGSNSTTAGASAPILTLKTSLSQLEQTRSSVTRTCPPPQHTHLPQRSNLILSAIHTNGE